MAAKRLAAILGVLSVASVTVDLLALPAAAEAPSRYGWWSAANNGLPFTAPPPQVPKGGLFVQNGYSGPVAISALTFEVPPGAAVTTVTLDVANPSVITQPPIACPIAPSSENYRPAEDGAWSDRPTYDCSVARVTATLGQGKTTASFDAGALLRGGTVSMVVLAGGSADAVAFDPPTPQSLGVSSTPAPASAPPPTFSSTPPTTPAAASPAPVATVAPTAPAMTPTSGAPAVPQAGAAAVPLVPAPALAAPSVQDSTAPAPAATGTSSGGSRLAEAAGAPQHGPTWRRDLAEAAGILALGFLLVAYSEGFGLLGGRIRPVGATMPVPPPDDA